MNLTIPLHSQCSEEVFHASRTASRLFELYHHNHLVSPNTQWKSFEHMKARALREHPANILLIHPLFHSVTETQKCPQAAIKSQVSHSNLAASHVEVGPSPRPPRCSTSAPTTKSMEATWVSRKTARALCPRRVIARRACSMVTHLLRSLKMGGSCIPMEDLQDFGQQSSLAM